MQYNTMFIILAICIFGAAILGEIKGVNSDEYNQSYLEKKIIAMEVSLKEDMHLVREEVRTNTEQMKKVVDLLSTSIKLISSHNRNSIVGNGPPINIDDGLRNMQYAELVNILTKQTYRNKRAITEDVYTKLTKSIETMQSSLETSIHEVKADVKSVNVKVEKITADVSLLKLVTVFDRLKISPVQNGRIFCNGNDSVFPEQCDISMWFGNDINLNQIVQNDVRLVNLKKSLTENKVKGKLEVFYREEWGTVCAETFNDIESTVACRHLGYANGTANLGKIQGFSSKAVGKIQMDNVNCTGLESSLFDCRMDIMWGTSCGNATDVGITCFK